MPREAWAYSPVSFEADFSLANRNRLGSSMSWRQFSQQVALLHWQSRDKHCLAGARATFVHSYQNSFSSKPSFFMKDDHVLSSMLCLRPGLCCRCSVIQSSHSLHHPMFETHRMKSIIVEITTFPRHYRAMVQSGDGHVIPILAGGHCRWDLVSGTQPEPKCRQAMKNDLVLPVRRFSLWTCVTRG